MVFLHFIRIIVSIFHSRGGFVSFARGLESGSTRKHLEDDFEHFVSRGFGAMRGGLANNRIAAQVAFEAMVDAASTLDDETRRETLAREGNLLILQAREHLVGPELDMVEARYQRFLQDIER